jgi:hypothetical protein
MPEMVALAAKSAGRVEHAVFLQPLVALLLLVGLVLGHSVSIVVVVLPHTICVLAY